MKTIEHDPLGNQPWRRLRRSLYEISVGAAVVLIVGLVLWITGIAARELLTGDLTSMQRLWGGIGFIVAFGLMGIAARVLR